MMGGHFMPRRALYMFFLNDGWPGGAFKKIFKKKLKQNKQNSDLWISTRDRGPLGFNRGPLGFNRGPKTHPYRVV